MALNIPMPSLPGDSFLKGMDAGSNMYSKIMNAKYNNSLHPSGDVANAMYVEQMRNQYGESDPRYIEAKRAHDMAMSGHQSLMDYRTQLSNLAPYRAATPEEKLVAAQEGKGVLQNFVGSKGQLVKPGMVDGNDGHKISEQEAKVYNQALGKKTTDEAIRNKVPYAENVKITLDSIVPEDLIHYSGVQGQIKYLLDNIKSMSGDVPQELMAFKKAETSAKTLSKQLRQFWGDSIQPTAMDKIDQLTNPSHWNKNPEIALQQFNQLKDITEAELQTFRDAGSSPLKLNYDKSTDSFYTTKKQNTQSNKSDDSIDAESEKLLNDYQSELIGINPEYTAENIKHTAKVSNLTVGQVIDKLLSGG